MLSGLCERYQISVPPIREALNQLQVEGVVVIEPNRGARVRSITPEFIREIFDIRIALEPALVEFSAPLFTAEDVAELEQIQDRFETAIANRQHAGVMQGNVAFHDRIYDVRPNQEAKRLLRQHSAFIATMRNKFGYCAGRLDQINKEHRLLIRACADRDAPLAKAIATTHIRHSVEDLRERMQYSPAPTGGAVPGLGAPVEEFEQQAGMA